jgi:hypothetical protein
VSITELRVPSGVGGRAVVGPSLVAQAESLVRSVSAMVEEVDRWALAGADAADGAALDGAAAASLAATFAALERVAAAGRTVAAGRVAASGQYRELGYPSAARWLASVSASGAYEAGRVLATAAHLDDVGLAATRAAFVRGSLTSTQAEEIARTASVAPEEVARLLAFARRETTARLREECRRVRLARKPRRRRALAEEMAFGTRDLGDGMGELFARMPMSWMVRVPAAVREQADAVFRRAKAEGRDDPQAAYLVEALVTLLLLGRLDGDAEGEADVEADAEGGAEADGSEDSGEARAGSETEGAGERSVDDGWIDDPLYGELLAAIRDEPPPMAPPRRVRRRRARCGCGGRVAPRAKILVRVDQAALARGWTEGGEVCDVAGVGPVPVATVRELWPGAVVKLVLTRGVDVVHVTHLGRKATEAMATALQWRGGWCSNLACDHDRFVQVDHRLGYANVHRTRVDELDGLCSECHALKTNENWQLVRGTGRRAFVPPEHRDHPGDPPTPRRR